MGIVATVVLWIAAATRIIVTIRRPDPARICMTLGAVCVASAFTLAVSANWFDAAVNWPNGAELLQHLLFAAAAYLILLFMSVLRVGTLNRRTLIRHSITFSIASLTMIVLFAIAPVHDQSSTNSALHYGSDLAAVLYRLGFCVYLICCLVLVARTSLRHGFTRGDWQRTVGLIGIGTGAAAAIAATAGAIQMLALLAGACRYSDPSTLSRLNWPAHLPVLSSLSRFPLTPWCGGDVHGGRAAPSIYYGRA
jgi:hypothetical protein